jgi:hypothetical protein
MNKHGIEKCKDNMGGPFKRSLWVQGRVKIRDRHFFG